MTALSPEPNNKARAQLFLSDRMRYYEHILHKDEATTSWGD